MREFLFNHALEVSVPESKVAVVNGIISRVAAEYKADVEHTRIKDPGADCYRYSIVAVSNQYASMYFRIGELFHFHKIYKLD